MNREINQAAQQNTASAAAYNEYHNLIASLKAGMGRGLLVDIHGQVKNFFQGF